MKSQLLAVLLVAAAARPSSSAEVPMTANDPAVAKLHAFFEREWDEQMRRDPAEASLLGDRRWNDRWPDVSLDAIAKAYEHDRAALAELRAMDRAALPPAEQINYDLYEYTLATRIEGYPLETYLVPMNTFAGIQMTANVAEKLRFETLKDHEDWLARLRAFPVYVEQTIALLQRGIERQRLQPRAAVVRIAGQVGKVVTEDASRSEYYKPFARMPESLPAKDRTRLAAEARTAVAQQVTPALVALKKFLEGPYWAAAPERPGVSQLRGGADVYAYLARTSTTTTLSPQAIHDIGLKEVARIRAEMEKLKSEVGYSGPLPAFFEHLRNDERFKFKGPDDVLEKTRAASKRIDPTIVKLFRTLPRMPYGIEPIPEAQAADSPPYYERPSADGTRAGAYYVNALRPELTWNTVSVALHETVPGHHFQIALAMELGDLPKFRRYGGSTAYTDGWALGGATAYVEGWGLYAESLGDELGVYDDPYQKFGRLANEMWRAVRLVVDTGMHALQWDRQKAIDYFKSQAPSAEEGIAAEVDRYIAWPGQALAYKIGDLKIQELRRRSAEKLGDRFDVKEFHDVVLLAGQLPLELLEKRVDAWVASRAAAR